MWFSFKRSQAILSQVMGDSMPPPGVLGQNETEAKEWIERSLAAWPRDSNDLSGKNWDRVDPHGQIPLIRLLVMVMSDKNFDRRERRKAYDSLVARARAWSDGVPVGELVSRGTIPDELLDWCVRVATGEIERPANPPGPDPFDGGVHNGKLENAVSSVAYYFGYSEAQAIRLVAEVAHLSEGSVKRAIRLTRLNDPPVNN